MDKISVYYFTKHDHKLDKTVTSKSMATLEDIKSYSGDPIIDTKKEVEESTLDNDGHYREPR